MKAVVVMDSLKGSLSSMEAGEAVKAGILAANPEATVIVKPLADGGEGTTEALVCGLNGRLKTIQVTGPIYEPVIAQYGVIDEVAVIDSGKVIEQATTKKMFLSPQSNLVREFLADMIYPKYPKKESISFNYVLYFLMNATNYARFQESKMEGTVYDIKTIHISGERFFAMYFLTNKIPDNEFIDQLISYEKVIVDV